MEVKILFIIRWPDNNNFIILVKIRKFNKAKPQPDVLEEEKLYAYHSNITSETGFR